MKRFVTIRMWNAVVGILAIVVFAGVLSLASPANATVINVDWLGHDAGPAAYSGQGAAPDTGTTWNGVATLISLGQPMTFTVADLKLSDGSASTIDLEVRDMGSGYRAPAGGLSLFDGYTQNPGANPPPHPDSSFAFTGLSGTNYDLYLISSHPWTPGGVYTVNGITKTLTASTNVSTFVENDNYVLYTGLTPIAGELEIHLAYPAGHLSGVQLSEVPEPGTLALLATGLIGLLAYAWRKRR